MRFSKALALGTKLFVPSNKVVPFPARFGLFGPPGGGKTEMFKLIRANVQEALQEPVDLVIRHPHNEDPTDTKGLPGFKRIGPNEDPIADFIPFEDMKEVVFGATQRTIVLADELPSSEWSVQKPYSSLFFGGIINGKKISPHVMWGFAGNRRQDRSGAQGMLAHVAGRFLNIQELEFNADDWAAWALGLGPDAIPVDLIACVRFLEAAVKDVKPTVDMTRQPDPRSLEALGRTVAQFHIEDVEVWSGTVGDAFASQYMAFRETYQSIPDKKDIFATPDTARLPERDKPAVGWALAMSLATSVDKKTMKPLTVYMERWKKDSGIEFVVACMKDIVNRPKDGLVLANTNAYREWAEVNEKYF
jgi:hypothetical protein